MSHIIEKLGRLFGNQAGPRPEDVHLTPEQEREVAEERRKLELAERLRDEQIQQAELKKKKLDEESKALTRDFERRAGRFEQEERRQVEEGVDRIRERGMREGRSGKEIDQELDIYLSAMASMYPWLALNHKDIEYRQKMNMLK